MSLSVYPHFCSYQFLIMLLIYGNLFKTGFIILLLLYIYIHRTTTANGVFFSRPWEISSYYIRIVPTTI